MKIQLIFYRGRHRAMDRAIQFWTRGNYSHCEIITANNPDGSVTCWSSSIRDGGVREKTMVLNPENWDIVEVDGDLPSILVWFEAHRGWKYDWLGLLGFLFRPITGSKNRLFCSEAVAASLGMFEPWRFDPNTLYAACLGRPAGLLNKVWRPTTLAA